MGPEALTSMNCPVERLVKRSLKGPVVSRSPFAEDGEDGPVDEHLRMDVERALAGEGPIGEGDGLMGRDGGGERYRDGHGRGRPPAASAKRRLGED